MAGIPFKASAVQVQVPAHLVVSSLGSRKLKWGIYMCGGCIGADHDRRLFERKRELGWQQDITVRQLVVHMADADMALLACSCTCESVESSVMGGLLGCAGHHDGQPIQSMRRAKPAAEHHRAAAGQRVVTADMALACMHIAEAAAHEAA